MQNWFPSYPWGIQFAKGCRMSTADIELSLSFLTPKPASHSGWEHPHQPFFSMQLHAQNRRHQLLSPPWKIYMLCSVGLQISTLSCCFGVAFHLPDGIWDSQLFLICGTWECFKLQSHTPTGLCHIWFRVKPSRCQPISVLYPVVQLET